MNTFSKKTGFVTIAIVAGGLAVAGAAAPAMASTTEGHATVAASSSNHSAFSSSFTRDLSLSNLLNVSHLLGSVTADPSIANGAGVNDSPIVVAPQVGDILSNNGDLLSGNAVASGNTVKAPVTAPIASGNQITAPVASNNQVPVASGNQVETTVTPQTTVAPETTVSPETNTTVSPVTDTRAYTSTMLGGIFSSLGLGLGR